jgi:NADH-quinone oxidoreductase subunit N
MLMGLAIVNREGVSAVLFYLGTYLFTNLGAFAVVAFLRNKTGSEDLSSFRGLIQSSPAAVIILGVCLLSLLGLPPLAGFAGKFVVFASVYHAAQAAQSTAPWLSMVFWALLVIGGINTVFSAFYYVKVLRVMVLEKPDEKSLPAPLPISWIVYGGAVAAIVLALGIAWNFLSVASDRGANFTTAHAVTTGAHH